MASIPAPDLVRPAREVLRWPRRAALAAGALLALWTTACGTVKSPTETPPPTSGGTALTFAQVQFQVFTPSCAKSGCHARSAASGGLVLEAGAAYGEIVGRPAQENPGLSRIAPGDPERSYLLKKIRGDADITGTRMPQDGPPFLSAVQIDGIAGWIRAGAPNN